MAQSGFTPIQLYRTATAAAVPVNTDLNDGELAINTEDEKLYFKNAAGTVKLLASSAAAAGGGTVSTVSVVSANGLTGTVANPTTTPAITLATSITGVLKGDGTALSAATAGTDYVAPGTATTFTALQTFSAGATITTERETAVSLTGTAIDLTTGNYFYKTVAANTTFTVSNPPSSNTAQSFILELTNGGAFTITWFAGLTFPGGVAPTLTASGRDVLAFFTRDGGTTWSGFVVGTDLI
tara:strand:- start:1162 stop:1881 length:720 start_codon:yes stop_codon:yes gene_type:complete